MGMAIDECSKCRNCCKELNCIITEDELDKIASCLKISNEELISKYLTKKYGEYTAKCIPNK